MSSASYLQIVSERTGVCALKAARNLIVLWIKRSRSRRELLRMTEPEQREIRIYPADVKIETSKWFWQA
jgi:uncharacterized protein YjiS (DUF1127 family)